MKAYYKVRDVNGVYFKWTSFQEMLTDILIERLHRVWCGNKAKINYVTDTYSITYGTVRDLVKYYTRGGTTLRDYMEFLRDKEVSK